MKNVSKFEPVTQEIIQGLARTLGPIQSMVCNLGEVDVSRGAGVLDKTTKCLWTQNGRRIEIGLIPGGYIASCSKEPDPLAPDKAS